MDPVNKTTDIEDAITGGLLTGGPITLAELKDGLHWVDDPRWIAVALMHLERDNRIEYPDCLAGHSHVGRCTIEVAS